MRPAFLILLIPLLLLSILLSTPTIAAQPATFTGPTLTKRPSAPAGEIAAPAVERARDRLGWLERHRLGVTPRNVARIVMELEQEGLIDGETPRGAVALLVSDRLQAENPGAFQSRVDEAKTRRAAGEIDWDAFLQALTRCIELLLELLERFSVFTMQTTAAGGDLAAWAPGGPPIVFSLAA